MYKITKRTGMLILASYLILVGLSGVFGFNLGQLSVVVPILALAAGIFILLDR